MGEFLVLISEFGIWPGFGTVMGSDLVMHDIRRLCSLICTGANLGQFSSFTETMGTTKCKIRHVSVARSHSILYKHGNQYGTETEIPFCRPALTKRVEFFFFSAVFYLGNLTIV